MSAEWESHYVDTNGIRLHVVQAGPQNGPLVVLLHGFPEFWNGWRCQIGPLAEAGYRVWVPDLRGYNLSDKPQGVAAYRIETLAADVIGLLDAAGREQAVLVGHDWGGAVAWWTAGRYPQRVARLVTLNIPHGTVFRNRLLHDPGQLLHSAYIFFFQIPWLPETLARAGNWWLPAQTLRRSSRPGTFSEADLDGYRAAWSQPGASTAMLNWYRAALRTLPAAFGFQPIDPPTLLLWGRHDRFLKWEMAQPSIDLCVNGRLVFLEAATHWLQHEEPAQVNALLLAFLNEGTT